MKNIEGLWYIMGSYTFKLGSRISGVTPVPNIFIDEYLPSADGNFVKVYLSGLLEAMWGTSVTGDMLSKKLGLLESDIIKAWEYWESKGLITITRGDGDMSIEFMGISPAGSAALKDEQPCEIYSPEYMTAKLKDPMIKAMYDDIQELFGRVVSPREFGMYLSWIEDFKFTPEVIILLIGYCKARNKSDARYIEKVAIGWHESGIASLEDAQRYISLHEEKYNNYRLVLDFLGLKENEIMKPQEELLNKWFNTWGFPLEMVLEACKICSLRINEPNFSYIDGILSNWYKNGIKALSEVSTIDAKKKTKNVKFKAPVTTFNSYDQRSYNIKELEKKLLGRDGEEENEQ